MGGRRPGEMACEGRLLGDYDAASVGGYAVCLGYVAVLVLDADVHVVFRDCEVVDVGVFFVAGCFEGFVAVKRQFVEVGFLCRYM